MSKIDFMVAMRGSYSEEFTLLHVEANTDEEILDILSSNSDFKNYKVVFIKPAHEIKKFIIETKKVFTERIK